MKRFGARNSYGLLKRVAVKRPEQAYVSQASIKQQYKQLNYPRETNFEAACVEHKAFVETINKAAGGKVEFEYLSQDSRVGCDSIYAYDPVIVLEHGAIILTPGKPERAPEGLAYKGLLEAAGIPIIGTIDGDATMECGDSFQLDEKTYCVGISHRTNRAAVEKLETLLKKCGIKLIVSELPHHTGTADCLHLMSNISPLDGDLAVVYSPLMSAPWYNYLTKERKMQLIEIDPKEYDTMACNVLAVAPRKAVMVAGNPGTRERLEKAGVEVHEYRGEWISTNGAGGPTCLTKALWRE